MVFDIFLMKILRVLKSQSHRLVYFPSSLATLMAVDGTTPSVFCYEGRLGRLFLSYSRHKVSGRAVVNRRWKKPILQLQEVAGSFYARAHPLSVAKDGTD